MAKRYTKKRIKKQMKKRKTGKLRYKKKRRGTSRRRYATRKKKGGVFRWFKKGQLSQCKRDLKKCRDKCIQKEEEEEGYETDESGEYASGHLLDPVAPSPHSPAQTFLRSPSLARRQL